MNEGFSEAWKRPVLLVVDDDPLVTEMLRMVLELSLEVEVVTLNSARQAADLLATRSISLLLTDYFMPEMNGLALIRSLRERDKTTPVILLTGYYDEREMTAQAGMLAPLAVVVKPWKNEDLLTRIRAMLAATVHEEA